MNMNNNITANILDSITKNQIQNNTGTVSADNAIMRKAVMEMLRDILPGDIVSGKLVSKEDSSISLLVKDNLLLNTVLEQNINLSVGKQVSFEVLNNQNGQLTLRPMFTNLNNSSTILNALNEASIPVSDSTTKMVDELMKNSMPIDRNTLLDINRELNLYPEANPSDIVMLHKLKVPVDDNSINQMHLYNNNNQWMMQDVKSSASELLNVINDMAMNVPKEEFDSFISNLKEALSDGIQMEEGQITSTSSVDSEMVNPDNSIKQNAINNENPIELPDNASNAGIGKELNLGDKPVSISHDNSMPNIGSSLANMEQSGRVDNNSLDEGVKGNSNVSMQVKNDTAPESVTTEKNSIYNDTIDNQATSDTKSILPEINKYNVFDKILQNGKEILLKPEAREQVKNAILESLKDNLLMNPKDVAKDDYVKRYYDRTSDLANTLGKLLNEHGKNDSEFAKSVDNIKNNMDFMNKVNEFYNYVQLPLKMNNSQANGDLHVYAKRKNKNSNETNDNLTALLHLSMEYLGNMDIFLTLKNGNNLSTKFTLEKEEMIDFISEHIEELNKRLVDKGYTLGVQEITKSEDSSRSVIDKIQGESGGRILLSNQSFDARA